MTFKEVGHGAKTAVYTSPVYPSQALLTPRYAIYEGESEETYRKTQNIATRVLCQGGSTHHLAVRLQRTTIPDLTSGLVLMAPLAQGDLHSALDQEKWTLSQRFEIAQQCGKALQALHQIGYVHGDVKLHNFLFFIEECRPVVRLSDWGETCSLDEQDADHYGGNLTFIPPERTRSCPGEIYSLGLIVVRLLEEALLNNEMQKRTLIPLAPTVGWKTQLRGILHYLFAAPGISRSCLPATQTSSSERSLVKRLHDDARLLYRSLLRTGYMLLKPTVINRFVTNVPENQAQIYLYVDTLCQRLKQEHSLSEAQAVALETLLKGMLSFDPAQRPSAQDVQQRLGKIRDALC